MKKILNIQLIIISFSMVAFAGNIKKSTRIIKNLSTKQIEFINEHFDFAMTPFLNIELRNSITKAKLFLYRSIQGTWEGFNQFDWEHINSHENMFCHSDSSNQSAETRILTIWNSWLMNGNDLVDKTAVDVMNHWINYYAVTASTQVYTYNYDGLFIDSAGHKLEKGAVNGNMPWDYDSNRWRDNRYAALSFIKSYLPDKIVIFNGLHSDNGADSSLSFTDGGMWEDFTFNTNTGIYKGEKKWWAAINCLQKNNKNSYLILVVKKPHLTEDITARIFSVASYLLVSNQNVVLSLSDWSHQKELQYFPEYDINIGQAIGNYIMLDDSLFVRKFTNGKVLVNPFSTKSKIYTLDKEYNSIIPVNGGVIDSSASYNGHLTFEKVNGQIEIPPISGLILQDSISTGISEHLLKVSNFTLKQNYPNPFNPTTTIKYQITHPHQKTGGHALIPYRKGKEQSGRPTLRYAGGSVLVKLKVFDILGKEVATLVNKKQKPGNYKVTFDASDLTSGIYFYSLNVNNKRIVKPMVLQK